MLDPVRINNGKRPSSDGEMIRVVSRKLLELLNADPGGVQRDLERIAGRLDDLDAFEKWAKKPIPTKTV